MVKKKSEGLLRNRDLIPQKKKNINRTQLTWAIVVGIALGWAVRFVVHGTIIFPFTVDTADMEPGVKSGSRIYIYRLISAEKLIRGDVVLAEHPTLPNRYMIRRVAALPGEAVQIKNGQVMVNGNELNEVWAKPVDAGSLPANIYKRDNTETLTLGPDAFFLLADHRANTLDSRQLGGIKVSAIKGRALR